MIYTYNCENCGEIEVQMSYKDLPLKNCPECNSTKIERIWQPTNNIWKCNGAYSKQNIKE